jgi:DNA-binding NtrC family response regulator
MLADALAWIAAKRALVGLPTASTVWPRCLQYVLYRRPHRSTVRIGVSQKLAMTPARRHLLFVDDEHAIRETLAIILRRYGFHVSLAANVAEALQHVAMQRFDLLLCDLNIEREGDGLDVIRTMKKINPDCVIIVLTGYPAVDSAVEGIRLGIDDYITKPANADLLVAALAEKLAKREPAFDAILEDRREKTDKDLIM